MHIYNNTMTTVPELSVVERQMKHLSSFNRDTLYNH